jgi:hypothetical protein
MSEWRNATRKHPCAICGRPDWCRYTEDGAVQDCYRQGDASAVERQDKSGSTFWRHRSGSFLPLYKRQDVPLPPSAERAGALDRDRVYCELLRLLCLTPEHSSALRTRGLTNADMERCGYGSLPLRGRYRIVKHLVHQFGQDLVAKVPGFVTKSGESGNYMTLAGSPGLLIPARNTDGSICGLVIRCDDPGDDGRYRWLSSRHGGGPGPEMAAHVPRHAGDANTVRLTEGQLKADIATTLSGVLTLGLPGCSQWRLALPVLNHFKPDMVLLGFDADWRTNPHVAAALGDCAKHLHKADFSVKVEDWHPSEGKGIDDLLEAGHQPQLKPWMYALVCKRRGTARKLGKVVVNGI